MVQVIGTNEIRGLEPCRSTEKSPIHKIKLPQKFSATWYAHTSVASLYKNHIMPPTHYGFAPHETRRSNMQISLQKNVQGMRNKMQKCQSFKSRVYINVITIVSALSVRILNLFIKEQCL